MRDPVLTDSAEVLLISSYSVGDKILGKHWYKASPEQGAHASIPAPKHWDWTNQSCRRESLYWRWQNLVDCGYLVGICFNYHVIATSGIKFK